MMSLAARHIPTLALAAGVALIASAQAAYDPRAATLSLLVLLSGTLAATAVVAACLGTTHEDERPVAHELGSALLVAATVALARAATGSPLRSDLALTLAALGSAWSPESKATRDRAIAGTLTAAACALHPAALLAPVAMLFAEMCATSRKKLAPAGVLTVLSAAAAGAGWAILGPPTTHALPASATRADVLILLPTLALAWIGWHAQSRSLADPRAAAFWWPLLGAAALAAALAGAPLDLRLAALPLFLLACSGTTTLADSQAPDADRTPRRARQLARVGLLGITAMTTFPAWGRALLLFIGAA